MSYDPRPAQIFLVLCALIAPAGSLEARPCAGISVDRAFSEASLIVRGQVLSTTPAQVPEGDSRSIIRIDRVLKGHSAQRQLVVTHFLCGMEYVHALQRGRPVIAFVDGQGGGLVGGTAVLPASGRLSDVADEPRAALRRELVLASADSDVTTARTALGALAELDGPAAIPTLQRYRRARDVGIRVRALAWLIRFGDLAALNAIVQVLSAPPFTPAPPGPPDQWHLTTREAPLRTAYDDLRQALWSFGESRVQGSTAPPRDTERFVAAVGQLAEMKHRALRRDAVHALRGLNHRASLPILASAIDDPDPYVRYDAVFTLCRAMHDRNCPSVPRFMQNEQLYIARVRAWWNARSAGLPPDAPAALSAWTCCPATGCSGRRARP